MSSLIVSFSVFAIAYVYLPHTMKFLTRVICALGFVGILLIMGGCAKNTVTSREFESARLKCAPFGGVSEVWHGSRLNTGTSISAECSDGTYVRFTLPPAVETIGR